jgi:hypothetical protein
MVKLRGLNLVWAQALIAYVRLSRVRACAGNITENTSAIAARMHSRLTATLLTISLLPRMWAPVSVIENP